MTVQYTKTILSIFFFLLVSAITGANDESRRFEFADSKIKLSETLYDFGDLSILDLPVSHEFKVTNISDTIVTLLQVQTTCSCASVTWNNVPLLRNDSTSIIVTLNNVIATGRFSKTVVVYVCNCNQPYHLKITGCIK